MNWLYCFGGFTVTFDLRKSFLIAGKRECIIGWFGGNPALTETLLCLDAGWRRDLSSFSFLNLALSEWHAHNQVHNLFCFALFVFNHVKSLMLNKLKKVCLFMKQVISHFNVVLFVCSKRNYKARDDSHQAPAWPIFILLLRQKRILCELILICKMVNLTWWWRWTAKNSNLVKLLFCYMVETN